MILYFSGTGNSEYVAKRIGETTGDQVLNLFDRLRSRDHSELRSSAPWVVAVPTYAWRIPRFIQTWLEQTPLSGNQDIYFVMTCGGSIGNAGRYLERFCAKKGLNNRGCFPITMPENYIALFSTPAPEEAMETVRRAEGDISKATLWIKNGADFPQPDITVKDRLNSGIVNYLFYPAFVHAKKFYATDACVSCGKCAAGCPLGNIRLENGKPAWGKDCTHCMACICRCPVEAIEYGTHSKGLPRYTFPNT